MVRLNHVQSQMKVGISQWISLLKIVRLAMFGFSSNNSALGLATIAGASEAKENRHILLETK
jgi:hypothetical protein